MAFQSRAVLWYVQVTKKLDGWQEKKKRQCTEQQHCCTPDLMNQRRLNPAEVGEQRQVKPSFKWISKTQAFQNQKSHRNLFSFFPCAEKFATFSVILLFFPCVLYPKWGKLGHLFPSQNGHLSLLHPTPFRGQRQ